ncbi:MAG: SIR2 family NAD-dependent protein deacylase, partial [Gammaproteobacteria bacterium]
MFSPEISRLLRGPDSRVAVLTGAGISAESGIPTFRGPEGYWTLGSTVYTPQEMATYEMFSAHPEEVWGWYLYRFNVCLAAQPNAGHRALAHMETRLGDRFRLITQNIDNLHIRAGNSSERTYQIHGNINLTRCALECSRALLPLPEPLKGRRPSKSIRESELSLLKCPRCLGWLRPHVLWFDEYYDEEFFRLESSLEAAAAADLLVIAGTSGATTLPAQVTAVAHQRGSAILDINIEDNAFSDLA